jgi:hypothetical protein
MTRLEAATMDLGLPQYFRGLALAELLRSPSRYWLSSAKRFWSG